MKKYIIIIILMLLLSVFLIVPENKNIVINKEYQVYKVWRGYANYDSFYLIDYISNGNLYQTRLYETGSKTVTVIISNKTLLVLNSYGNEGYEDYERWTLYLNNTINIYGISSEYTEGKSTTQSSITEVK